MTGASFRRRGSILRTALLFALMPWATAAYAQQVVSCPAPAPIVDGLTHPMAAVRYLADDALEGRLSGTPGERCTSEYIALEFARIGLAPGGDGGSFLQEVPLQSIVNPHAPGGTGTNVIGFLEGADPILRSEAVVVGAHHDHLGRGEVFGSLARPEDGLGAVHNGADDNASGVGALISVAKTLISGVRPSRSIVFVTFTGEELGLLGSAHYVRNPTVPLERTIAMLNMDMVGRLEADPLIVNGTGTATEWNAVLDSLEAAHTLALARAPEGFGPSDHASFYGRDIPVLHFFTNVHEQYHRPSDEWYRIDAEGLERVSALVAGTVLAIANRPERLTHVPGIGTPPGAAPSGSRAYLGSVPDFAPVDFGVRLSGVTAGSPADQAGIRPGDVLIRLGGLEIGDLYALTEALEALDPGRELQAVVLREGQELTLTVVLGTR
jgi:hypothetical protein